MLIQELVVVVVVVVIVGVGVVVAAAAVVKLQGGDASVQCKLSKGGHNATKIGDENWTQSVCFTNFSGTSGIWSYPSKIPGYPFDFPGFEGHTELFGPHPFTRKTPTPPENIRTKKFGFGFLFRPWKEWVIMKLHGGISGSLSLRARCP